MSKTNKERILDYLQSIAPKRVTNGEIREATGVRSHQHVYRITRELREALIIQGSRQGHEWVFWVEEPVASQATPPPPPVRKAAAAAGLTPYAFENLARSVMSLHLGLPLTAREVPGVPKEFDMISPDRDVVGDAKYYTLVRGKRLPPVKFSVIAEHVWLLEKTNASTTFLVFGNQRKAPKLWLERYGGLVGNVDFYFLSDEDDLEQLT